MAKVLNGEVEAGDRVAYATRDGNTAAIHLGTVVEVREKSHSWKEGVTISVLKVRVETETDATWHSQDRLRHVAELDRVVKL